MHYTIHDIQHYTTRQYKTNYITRQDNIIYNASQYNTISNTAQYTTLNNIIQDRTTYNEMQNSALHYNIIRDRTIQHNTAQYDIVPYHIE